MSKICSIILQWTSVRYQLHESHFYEKSLKRPQKENCKGDRWIRADYRARLLGFKSQLHTYFIFSVLVSSLQKDSTNTAIMRITCGI